MQRRSEILSPWALRLMMDAHCRHGGLFRGGSKFHSEYVLSPEKNNGAKLNPRRTVDVQTCKSHASSRLRTGAKGDLVNAIGTWVYQLSGS
jgi:hypothetical protein